MARVLEPFAGAAAESAATALIIRFGSPARALAAHEETIFEALPDLANVAAMIVAARRLFDFGLSTVMQNETVDVAAPQFIRFLAATLGREDREILLAIYLDHGGCYLTDERVAIGGMASVEVALRPLVVRAVEVGARGVLLAHNHPSGDARPSKQDRRATDRIADVLLHLEISLIDHLVVGGSSVFSIARGKRL